jgi:FHA domain/DUF1707 SHOCT-like domain
VDFCHVRWHDRGVGSAVPTSPSRPSLSDRERVADRLREACYDDRISLNTFVARLDLAYAVRTEAELRALLADIPEPNWFARLAMAATEWASRQLGQFGEAWTRPHASLFVLPTRETVLLGRSRGCDCVIPARTVSRRHAVLSYREGRWVLQDLASLNGTYLNGARVIDDIEVRPGDEVSLGRVRFRLAPPGRPA